MSKYPKLNNGESIRMNLDKENLHYACCDCGLVHRIQFCHIKKNTWDFAFFRLNRATGQLRRHKFGELFKSKQRRP